MSNVRQHKQHRIPRMDESAFLTVLRPYFEAFAETEVSRRLQLLAMALSPDAEIWGPRRVFAGYGEISEKIDGFHKNWPGCRLVLATGLNTFLSSVRFGNALVDSQGTIRASGHAVAELAEDGRIRRVIPFWESLPPLPVGWPLHLSA
jgi:hypothetical protein